MRFRMLSMLILGVWTTCLLACGSPLDNPGVAPEKPLDTLTQGEQKKLADTVMDAVYSAENIKTSCYLSAYAMATSTGGKERCESFLQTCEKLAASRDTYAEGLQKQYASCKGVTVQEWTACMKVMIRYLNELKPAISQHSCDKPLNYMDLITYMSAETLKDYTTKCQAVMTRCYSSSGSGTSPPSTP